MSSTHGRTRDLALTATFAGLIAGLGLVPAVSPFGFPVLITLQSLGIMITGQCSAHVGARPPCSSSSSSSRWAFPSSSGGRGGLGVFAGPSLGYLVGFPIAAFVIGALIFRRGAPYSTGYGLVAIVLGGIIVLYAIGVPPRRGAPASAFLPPWRAASSSSSATSPRPSSPLWSRVLHRGYPGLLPHHRSAAARARDCCAPTAERVSPPRRGRRVLRQPIGVPQ